MKTILDSDILITENIVIREIISWDDTNMIKSMLPSLELLKKTGIVKDTPFLFQGTAWTRHIKQTSLEFLRNNLEPALNPLLNEYKKTNKEQFPHILNKFPIDNINPIFVRNALYSLRIRKLKNIGMDRQIMRNFDLNGKLVLGLETSEELGDSLTEEKLNQIAQASTDDDIFYSEINILIDTIKHEDTISPEEFARQIEIIKSQDLTTKLSDQKSAELKTRNKLWIPRLLEYFNKYQDKTIVVVVGVHHFTGENGILKLFRDEGFEIKYNM